MLESKVWAISHIIILGNRESLGNFQRSKHGGITPYRRERQTTSLFLPGEPYEQYEKNICYGEEWRNISRKNEEAEPKQKQCPVVDVTGDGSKDQCYKERYCIGTWNVRSMNQGKLEVVKQEMASVNMDTLGISEWKWMKMDEFNSDDHYIYYCGQEFLRRNGVALIVKKRVWNAVLGCRMISVCFQVNHSISK